MKTVALVLIVLVFGAAYLAYFFISTASHDPATWHVDPIEAEACGSPNCYFLAPEGTEGKPLDAIAPIYGKGAFDMAKAFHEFALAQIDTEHVDGVPAGLNVTYVQRTKRLRFPDYISVKFIDLPDDRSTIAVFSRSRYGQGDLGVNEARVKDWIAGLASFEVTPPAYSSGG